MKKYMIACMNGVIFLIFLRIGFWILMSQNQESNKGQNFANPPTTKNKTKNIVLPKNTNNTTGNVGSCTFSLASAQYSLEEQLILASIAWPQTPLSLGKKSTHALASSFTIDRGSQGWRVGDELTVRITMMNSPGDPKKTGGDVIVARMLNKNLKAGVAGHVLDHENGSYTATLPLLWAGNAYIEVILLHPSEAVAVIRRLNQDNPDRVYFKSIFRLKSVSEKTTCNYCLRPANMSVCDFTDVHKGEPWFCYKPKHLGCETRISHSSGGFMFISLPNTGENNLFKNDVTMKARLRSQGPAFVNVSPQEKGRSQLHKTSDNFGHSGFYVNDEWRALNGTTVQHFNNSSAMSECLHGKKIYMYGDSTIRQWYSYLVAQLPGLLNFNFHNGPKTGPYMATDYGNNIIVNYRPHGVPIRIDSISVREVPYIANELDALEGGPNTVVILGIWAHFGSFPDIVYLRRLHSIRKAVVELLSRSPSTLVVIRNGNIKELSVTKAVYNSDWTTMQHNKILQAVFRGVNVRWVDAWEMALAHSASFQLHPLTPIVKNMVDVVLSYICPVK